MLVGKKSRSFHSGRFFAVMRMSWDQGLDMIGPYWSHWAPEDLLSSCYWGLWKMLFTVDYCLMNSAGKIYQ